LRNVPERILVYGYPGSGKSYQFLKIADFMLKFNPKAKCYIFDTDDAYTRMLFSDRFSHLPAADSDLGMEIGSSGNCYVYPVFEWPEWEEKLERIYKKVKPGDWVCVDRADVLWEAIQEYYVEQVFGAKMGDYFLRARMEMQQLVEKGGKEKKNLVVLEGDKDWQVINRLYKQLWTKMIAPGFPAHLYVATVAKEIQKRDEQIIKDTYGWIGAQPGGQKHLAYQVHTVLYLSNHKDEWFVTTIDDREREYFDREELHSLPTQYLVKIGKWRRSKKRSRVS